MITLRDIKLELNGTKFSATYCVVVNRNGVFEVELFYISGDSVEELLIEEDARYFTGKLPDFFNNNYDLSGYDRDNNLIKLIDLSPSSLNKSNNKIGLSGLWGKVVKYKEDKHNHSGYPDVNYGNSTIYYVELEGLALYHIEGTTIKRQKFRSHSDENVGSFIKDHTTSELNYYNLSWTAKCSNWTFIYYDMPSGNILVEIKKNINGFTLSYNSYLEIRDDWLLMLSFMSSSPVYVRKEYTGNYYGRITHDMSVRSQIEITYSFKQIQPRRGPQFLPNSLGELNGEVVSRATVLHFTEWRRIVDRYQIQSIVSHLNQASYTESIPEAVFILTIALEKLAYIHYEIADMPVKTLIEADKFEELKEKLLKVLKENRALVGKSLDKFGGRIGELNKELSSRTRAKSIYLFKSLGIELNDFQLSIIHKIRNSTVHEGRVENDSMGYSIMVNIDLMIRHVILNLIDYSGDKYKLNDKN